jgi:hypothetical protein
MKLLRLALLMLAVGVLALLPTLAHASSVDPSWIQGIYDDADNDDILTLITEGAGVIEPFPLDDIFTGAAVITRLHEPDNGPVRSEAPSVIHARAPPAY